jgi:hypothetical protein
MKKYSVKLLFIVLFVLSGSSACFSQIPDQIVSSIGNGNAEILAGYFNQNVELVVESHDDVFSKSQAQQIVANFFQANKPKQFTIIHQGGKEGARYVIGSLTANTGTFRVYFLLRGEGAQSTIHQLKIEKQA